MRCSDDSGVDGEGEEEGVEEVKKETTDRSKVKQEPVHGGALRIWG